jgi:hypothetical protein
MPVESTLQTAVLPSQQFCEALMLMTPPSGSLPAPQMLPVELQNEPLSQAPSIHWVLETVPAPQQLPSLVQKLPVVSQPLIGWQMGVPVPRSTQVREQQLVPLEQGLPSFTHPPLPPPVMMRQRPTPPSTAEHALPQHSVFRVQRSP